MDFEQSAQEQSVRRQAVSTVPAANGKAVASTSALPESPGAPGTCCGEELRPFWAEDGRLISVCKHCGREHMDQGMVRFGGSPWIGVDLDGTLAEDVRRDGNALSIETIGAPIEPMMRRVKTWLAEGKTIKIFTARASVPRQVELVKRWLAEHGLPDLEVTNTKDFAMIELWDDRCVQVTRNSGEPAVQVTIEPSRRSPRRSRRRNSSTGLFSKIRMYLAL